MKEPIPCIICYKEMQHAFDDPNPASLQPSDGLHFSTRGHYGSALYDPMPAGERGQLDIIVCDDCLDEAATNGRVWESSYSVEKIVHRGELWESPKIEQP